MNSVVVALILLLLIIIIPVFLAIDRSVNGLRKQMEKLEGRISLLESAAPGKAGAGASDQGKEVQPLKPAEKTPSPPPAPIRMKSETVKAQPAPGAAASAKTAERKTVSAAVPPKPVKTTHPPAPSKAALLWKNAAEKFMQNWTGVIGALLTVMGVGFLGVYTALKCAPFYRFLIIDAFALLLVVAFFILERRHQWLQFALWLRSIAGAVFLFGCVGSGGIEGLRWIEQPGLGLGVLFLGIAANLFLGIIGGKQLFASLHVLLSLAALAIAPPSMVILAVAAVVALFGIALTYRERWEPHLLLTMVLFFAYHAYWVFNLPVKPMGLLDHAAGIASVVGVGLAALLTHYRGIFSREKAAALPLITHLSAWVLFALGVLMHESVIPWKAPVLGAAAVAAYLLSRRAKRLGISWLYTMDALMAQFIALTALWALSELKVSPFTIGGFVFAEILLFCVVVKLERDTTLYQVGNGMAVVAGLGLASIGYFNPSLDAEVTNSLLLASAAGLAFHLFLKIKFRENADAALKGIWENPSSPSPANGSLLEFLIGLFPLAIYKNIYQYAWAPYALAGLALVFLLIRWRYQSNGLGIGLALSLAGVHALTWSFLYYAPDLAPLAKLNYSAPLFLLSLASWFFSYVSDARRHQRWLGKTLFFFHAMATTYLVFAPLWPLVYVSGVIFVETLLYLVFVNPRQERRFLQAGLAAGILLALALAASAFWKLDYSQNLPLYQRAGTLAAGVLALIGLYGFYRWRRAEVITGSDGFSVLMFLAAMMLGAAFVVVYRFSWSGYALLALAGPLMFYRCRAQVNGMAEGINIMLLAVFGLAWFHLWQTPALGGVGQLLYGAPWLGLAWAQSQWSYVESSKRFDNWLGIYLGFIHLLLLSYFATRSISPFIPGVAWLALSLVALEMAGLARRKYKAAIAGKGQADRYLLHMGCVLLGAFLVRHLIVHLQSEAFLAGALHMRTAIEILALAVFVYWGAQPAPSGEPKYNFWTKLHPLFLELILAFLVLTLAVELDSKWHPAAWAALGLAAWGGKQFLGEKYSRLDFYSLLLIWAAAVNVAFIASTYVTPSRYWLDQSWVAGVIAIILQLIYVGLVHQRSFLAEANYPPSLRRLKQWSATVARRRDLWIYYPLFAAVAVFLFWSFDKSTLTLLWVLECFAIFVLSVILRENHFRYLALLGLVACLARLVAYDLAKAQTLIRAVVFLGVGVLMIIMNGIYVKYKARFEAKERHE